MVNEDTEITEEVQMGTYADDTGLYEEVEKEFIEYCKDAPFLIFAKKDIAHFVNLLAYNSKMGFDMYTKSFKLDCDNLDKTGKAHLVYNNGAILAESYISVKFQGKPNSCIIAVDTFLRVFSASQGAMCVFSEGSNLYGHVFGGRAYLETIYVEKDICSKEALMEVFNLDKKEEKQVPFYFINTLKGLYDVVKSGARTEERAIYFEDGSAYIYSGRVMGKFPGIEMLIVLQDIDISTLSGFFVDVHSDITITDYDLYMKYSFEDRHVCLAKRALVLSDEMKFLSYYSDDSVTIDIKELMSIVNFLLSAPDNNGILNISSCKEGLNVVCYQKVSNYNSFFNVSGVITGRGITEISIPLETIRTYLKVFNSSITFRVKGNKLYISGSEGEMVIYGRVNE